MAGRPGYGLIFTKFIKMCIEKGEKKPRLFKGATYSLVV